MPIESVKKIHDQKTFISFLRDQLNWHIEENIEFEDATYYWDTDEFNYPKEYFMDSVDSAKWQ